MNLGIDFGTTRTVVAVADRGNFVVLSFEDSEGDLHDFIPTLAATDGERWVYGFDAAEKINEGWSGCQAFKRLLNSDDSHVEITIADQTISLPFLISGFLGHVREMIREHSNAPTQALDEQLGAMIAVPAKASSIQRFITLDAFTSAGFVVNGILNEPTAAGIAFAHRFSKQITKNKQQVIIYDLGGGTFDASLVDMSDDHHRVVSNVGLNDVGGQDLDALLLDLAGGEVNTLNLERCRQAKESIHANTKKISISLENEDAIVSTADFYKMATPMIERTISLLDDLLEDQKHLAGVYVTGGASDLPLVSRLLRKRFARKVRKATHPSGATAIGLCIAAAGEAPKIEEQLNRHVGVFREERSGQGVFFDSIITPEHRVGHTTTRSYRPAHNIGVFRFAETDQLDSNGVPTGFLAPTGRLVFAFDDALQDKEIHNIPVAETTSNNVITETWSVDEDGLVTVTITDSVSGHTKSTTLGRPPIEHPAS